jgi:hypothetical protein
VRLTTSPGLSMRPSIVAKGGELHIVWFEGSSEDSDIFYLSSNDFGATWSAPRAIAPAPGIGALASIAMSNEALHVVWYDERAGKAETFYARGVFGPAP